MAVDENPSLPDLPNLTERQEYILSLIVREYTRDPQPVASKTLVERFELGVSSATVRNEMVLLEEEGLIYAPHTSAGACRHSRVTAILCTACCGAAIYHPRNAAGSRVNFARLRSMLRAGCESRRRCCHARPRQRP